MIRDDTVNTANTAFHLLELHGMVELQYSFNKRKAKKGKLLKIIISFPKEMRE